MTTSSAELAAQALRLAAEQQLARQTAGAQAEPQGGPDLRLLHELQVHQVELQMQNESLRLAQADTEQALDRLAQLNAQLEAKVLARTADLVAARDLAQAASRAKTQFLSQMSHELRTPISGVIGMLDLALLRASDSRQAEWLALAKRSAWHLLSVINDILDVARIESGRTTLAPAPFQLQSVLDDVAGMVAPDVQRKGLVWGLEVAPALAHQQLLGDSLRLKQVLLNLCGNAVKFTLTGAVALRVKVLQASAAELLLRFEVQDTGIGIAQTDQARLFRSFEQLDQADSRRFGGTGLGLAISDQLVRLMGGRLGAHSRADRGSLFWFTTRLVLAEPDGVPPLARPADAALPAPVAQHPLPTPLPTPLPNPLPTPLPTPLAACPVLLVHGAGPLRDGWVRRLGAVGLQVTVADQLDQALHLARTERCVLVLVDLQLPQLDWAAATAAIRQLPDHARTPLLGLAEPAAGWSRGRCQGAGMDDLLLQPMTQAQLLGALLSWLPPDLPVW